jgi:hypothetical protein
MDVWNDSGYTGVVYMVAVTGNQRRVCHLLSASLTLSLLHRVRFSWTLLTCVYLWDFTCQFSRSVPVLFLFSSVITKCWFFWCIVLQKPDFFGSWAIVLAGQTDSLTADTLLHGLNRRKSPLGSQEGYGTAAVLSERGIYLTSAVYRPVLQVCTKPWTLTGVLDHLLEMPSTNMGQLILLQADERLSVCREIFWRKILTFNLSSHFAVYGQNDITSSSKIYKPCVSDVTL